MFIKEVLTQHRRDFTAILECEHCHNEQKLMSGYDDDNYHDNVIPKMKCKACGKEAAEDTPRQATKYPEGYQV